MSRKAGFTIPNLRKYDHLEAYNLHKNGYSYHALARMFGVSAEAMRQAFDREKYRQELLKLKKETHEPTNANA